MTKRPQVRAATSPFLTRRRILQLISLTSVSAACACTDRRPDSTAPTNTRHSPRVVDVRATGAKGDGRTDDTLAIRTAINSVRRLGGGVVSFPYTAPGYLCGSITLPSFVTLAGSPRARLRPAHPQDQWIVIAPKSTRTALKSLDLDAEGRVHLAVLTYGMGATTSISDDCAIRNLAAGAVGIDFRSGTRDVTVHANQLTSCSTAIRLANRTMDITIDGCSFKEWIERAIWVRGTATESSSRLTITRNIIHPPAAGGRVRQPIQFNGTSSSPHLDVLVSYNNVFGNDRDYMDATNPGTADLISLHECINFTVAGNTCADGGDVGITVAHGSRSGVIRGNHCVNNGSAGIAVGSGTSQPVSRIEVTDNTCTNNGRPGGTGDTTPAWARAGVLIDNADCVTITGNTCTNTPKSASQLYGVTIHHATDARVQINKLGGNSRLATLQR